MNGLDVNANWIGDDSLFSQLNSIQNLLLEKKKKMKEMMAAQFFPIELLKANKGLSKVILGGPTCTVDGIEILCIIYHLASGGIILDILVDILCHYDQLVSGKFGDLPPAIILDGHGSRLSIQFLHIVNNLATDRSVIG